jgi:uncharacterized protein YkwD
MKKNLFYSFLVVCCLLGSCKKGVDTAPKSYNPETLLTAINALRATGCVCGSGTSTKVMPPVRPAVWNSLLEKAAQYHSDDMEMQNYYSHGSKDGRGLGTRVSAVGYKWGGLGEAIGGADTDEHFIEGIQKSQGHCEGMMSADWYEIGIARSGVGYRYTYVMATPAR